MLSNAKRKRYEILYNVIQMLFDGLAVYGILCAAMYVYYLCGAKYEMTICLRLVYVPLIVITINSFARLYGGNVFYPGVCISRVEELKRFTLSTFSAYIVLFAYLGVTRTIAHYSRVALLASMCASILIVPFLRNLLQYCCWKYRLFTKNILIAGANETGRKLAAAVQNDWHLNVRVAGFLDDTVQGKDILGKIADFAEVAESHKIHYLAICLPVEQQLLWYRNFLKVFSHLLLLPDSELPSVCGSYPVTIGNHWALEISNHLKMRLYRWEKILVEICIICIVLPLLVPLCFVIALLIKLTSPGPVFYRAKRLGMAGKPIRVLKFRTMYKDADTMLEQILEENPEMKKEWEERFKLQKDPRVTPLGRFLRQTSLDELPQFWNVLRGEMAIIGPRPIVTKEICYYGEDFSIFSQVKPGISGLWQVSGRSSTSYETRVKLDVYYVANWSIWLDYYIFMNTVIAVLLRKGAQ